MTVNIKEGVDSAQVASIKGMLAKEAKINSEGSGQAHSLGESNEASEGQEHQHVHGHSHQHSGGCCSGHECVCARATQNVIKSFLPLLGEEREAELTGWTLNDETWACVPNPDAPAFAFVQGLYGFKSDKVANEQPTVNAFMKVLNTLNHHARALPSRFFTSLTYTTDLSQHGIDDITTRVVIPTHRFGAWIGILIETRDQRATIFDPCATLSGNDLEEIKGRLSVFDLKEHHVMTPKRPIHMRYSVVAVCTGLEVLARAGFATVAPRVFSKLTEIIGLGGDLDAILNGLTEESMHADDNMTKEDKLAAMMDQLDVDPASNISALQFADRIAWSLATCKLNAPKWQCACAEKAVEKASSASSDGGSDKENVAPPEPDHSVDEPALKKRKE